MQNLLFILVLIGIRVHGIPDIIVLVTCSAHYTDFFENWYAWLIRLKLHREIGLIVIAEDSDVYPYLEKRVKAMQLRYSKVVRSHEGGTARATQTHLGFESQGFASLMSRRAAHLSTQLRILIQSSPEWAASPRSRLIFSDLDAIWIRDPRQWFRSEPLQGCDAWAQTQHRERKLLNPGFLALAPTPGSELLLTDWERRLFKKPQRNLPVFNEAISALGEAIHICALPPELFLSAKRSFRNRHWSPLRDPSAIIAHANWIDGHDDKRAAFQAVGAWLLRSDISPLVVPASAAVDRSPYAIHPPN